MRKKEKIIKDRGWFSVVHLLKSGGDDGSFPLK